MIRNMKCKMLMHRALAYRMNSRCSMLPTSLLCRKKPESLGEDITITDINIHDLAKGDLEFRRNFLTSPMLLRPEVELPKTEEDATSNTKGKSTPKTTADAAGTQAPTASDVDDAAANSTVKLSSEMDLEGKLLNLRNEILVHRTTMSRWTSSLLCRKQPDPEINIRDLGKGDSTASDGDLFPADSTVKVCDVLGFEGNHRATMERMATSLMCRTKLCLQYFADAKGQLEFRRNFQTSGKLLDSTPNTMDKSSAKNTEDASETQAPTASDGNGDGAKKSSVLDLDGNQITPIEIDGWKQDDESDPTVQNNTDIDIGNDDEYNDEMLLKVPEKREGEFSYKGITIKLPESASQDIGTYRFRRDAEDLECLADDMRIVKFDKK
ncbi:uncharacterized protein LOC117901811 [Drosophila subobscura]|uniref:uncharacterized protein LOC117901811 n=1 Tax=Drosophila subobscura TaxID=7241 RepID=UPI00155A87B3|nr:uncharacterized protein LOC117901811 [Drosophila subobscura]